MQKCDFNFEILIHDDASTDGTAEIIKEYQQDYPEIIKPILQEENQWSKGVRTIQSTYNFSRARGKYIALCEGDDYWTDPLKLQKQVNFLREHSEYSFVVGGFYSQKMGDPTRIEHIKRSDHENEPGFAITLEMAFSDWYTKTLTLLFRKDAVGLDFCKDFKYCRDVHLIYFLLKQNNGYYQKQVFGVYNIHEGGVHSMVGQRMQLKTALAVATELYQKERNLVLKKFLFRQIAQNIYYNAVEPNKRLKLLVQLIRYASSPQDWIIVFKIVIRSYILRMRPIYSLNTNS